MNLDLETSRYASAAISDVVIAQTTVLIWFFYWILLQHPQFAEKKDISQPLY